MSESKTALTRSILGYADLVKVHTHTDSSVTQLLAEQLGLRFIPPDIDEIAVEASGHPEIVSSENLVEQATPPPPDNQGYPANVEDVAVWLPTFFAFRDPSEAKRKQAEFEKRQKSWNGTWWTNPPIQPLLFTPIAPWSILKGRIQSLICERQSTRAIAVDKLVSQVANAQVIRNLPLEERPRTRDLLVIRDRSTHLIPFWEDQDYIVSQLQREHRGGAIRLIDVKSRRALYDYEKLRLERPGENQTVLVLGDLGVLSESNQLVQDWFSWGKFAIDKHTRIAALVPCSLNHIPHELSEQWLISSMQSEALSRSSSQSNHSELLRLLLVLASPSSSVSPRLLRGLRRLIPTAIDAALESQFWKSEFLSSQHHMGATIRSEIVKQELRPEFERLDPGLRERALALIRDYHTDLHPTTWLNMVLSLSESSQSLLPKSDRSDAVESLFRIDYLRRFPSEEAESMGCFLNRSLDSFTDEATTDPEVGKIIHSAWAEFRPNETSELRLSDPGDLPSEKEARYGIAITDRCIQLRTIFDRTLVELPRGYVLRSSNAAFRVEIQPTHVSSLEASFWKGGKKPDYVSDFGRDEFGAWFEFQLPHHDGQGVVTQRMRWIAPGSFMMGSPKQEKGRYSDEGPQNRVSITKGFWLADTPCTQELWQAMTGTNPSQHFGPKRPVEKVSWDDVTDALNGLSQRLLGLDPGLPSEAQWEYACRAGTTTVYNVGDTLSPEDANFAGELNGTCDVKRYRPNAWGLFDIHGNVWEWCRDGKRKYSETPQVDPTDDSEGSNRVIRGGSWFDVVRYVRSACRSRFVPGHRGSLLGFRLLSLASSEPSRFGAAEVFSHVFSIHDFDAKPIEFPLADLVPVSRQPTLKSESEPARSTRTSTLLLSSNLEKIRYERVEKPEWAVAYGQDPYGTYADIRVDGLGVETTPVRQRLRWIPPGRFQMGSPEGEPGRRDDESLHEVTLSHGYWMFDTPCTQRLWQAVMSNNPSTFKDPDRPVENVSWDDANEFAASWNRKLTRFGIEFRLPTEAEWEYACRAGTASAIYSGDLEILGDANAPALDAIAWYGGNSGHEYDLDASESLEYSWLSDQQYPAKRGGTRKVKGKAPNALGLYDMLGNVWEWCSDWYSPYGGDSSIDPTGDIEGSARVVRGGSWFGGAAHVRSAYRHAHAPVIRSGYLGFRLLSSATKTKQVTGDERRERFEREAEGRGRTKNKRSK